MASFSGPNVFILFVFLAFFLIANLAGSVQMNDSKKTDSNRRVKNITLNDAEDRLDELNEMLTQRLMQIDQIRSELGGRETSCSAKDHECSIYYRVKSTNFIRFFSLLFPLFYLVWPGGIRRQGPGGIPHCRQTANSIKREAAVHQMAALREVVSIFNTQQDAHCDRQQGRPACLRLPRTPPHLPSIRTQASCHR